MDVASKKIILAVISIMIIVILSVGITYAMFSYTKVGKIENIIKTGTIAFDYVEEETNGINLINALPIDDSIGKSTIEDSNVFDFKISSSNKSNQKIKYQIIASISEETTIDLKAIKIYLTEVNNGIEQEVILNTLNSFIDIDNLTTNGKIIYSTIINDNSPNYEKNYRIRLWISNDPNLNLSDYSNKNLGIKINVNAEAIY
ncbi:MAG: hypothetical protein PHQ64_02280 [Bacilli bacterium]|nr:hypothetical protein [Bacilli bacterium]